MHAHTWRRTGVALLTATALIGAAGCGSGDTAQSGSSSDAGLEQSSIDIGLTGVGSISNVPLYLADSLGYFKDNGLTVKLTAVKGGTTAIQSLVTNTVDATTNEYIHTLSLQQQNKNVESVAVFSTAPTYSLVVTKGHFDATVKDLPNMNIGVVSLGGSTEDLIRYVFETNDLDPAAAKLVATGAGSTQTAAIKAGQVGALIATEPTLTSSLESGEVKPLVDFRKPSVIEDMFGGKAPFWSLLVTNKFAQDNPKTVQALVSANVKALDYIHSHSAQEIADRLPGDLFYPDGNKDLFIQILEGVMDGFSTDAVMPQDGPQRIADYLKVSRPDTDLGALDLSKTYDDSFAKAAAH